MDFEFNCPQCEAPNRVAQVDRSTVLTCGQCDYVGVLPLDWHRAGEVDLCPMCGDENLFCRHDYRVGMIVGLALVGLVLMFRTRFLSLVAAAAVVAVHLLRAEERLICYRCGSRISGHHPRGQRGRYDPAMAAHARATREPDGDRSNSTP